CDLVDIVSKNGTLLLNVGPKADGTIGPEDTAVLKAIGAWMKMNGEAIYDTHVWRAYGEGPTKVEEGQFTDGKEKVFTPEDIRFTVKGEHLYATVLKWPEDGQVLVRSLASARDSHEKLFQGILRDVHILGYDGDFTWEAREDGLYVSAPKLRSDMPVVIKVAMD
ncbi:MAG: alpha-L-fucosidase, partial [Clostridia bacterium]|nr:alpha-L-fucosidase [Clostridia bacterium]